MTVLITLTTAGTDSGPTFNLYSNTDGSPFETGVSKSALLAGYTSILVPNFTSTVRVTSIGVCTNSIDIFISGNTTTTTSTTLSPVTTTTTSTAPPSFYSFQMSSPGRSSSGLACAEVSFPFIVYSDLFPLDLGSTVYTSNTLTTPIPGGDLWYKEGVDGVAYQINSSGVIIDFFNCP